MLWQAQHGATAKKFRDTQDARGAPIPAYLFPPDPLPGVDDWFMAFWELSTERKFPGGPIPHSAIASWPTDEPDMFRECIRAADAAYLDFIAKPIDDKPTEPLRPGILKGKG